MGYLNVSPRIAILSLGLLALAGCQDAGQSSSQTRQASLWPPGETELIICPGDRRCGEEQPGPDIRAQTCRLHETRFKFKCGEQDLPCPGKGCPTGEPGLPDQKCWLSETFIDVRCPSSPGVATVADGEAPAASATPVEPAPAPAEKAAQ